MDKEKLITNLHKMMRKDPVTREILGTTGSSFMSVSNDIDELHAQLNIDTATWGLAIYERELGIVPDQQSYEARREITKAKLRGTGKVDRMLIKITAEAFANGEVDVSFNGQITVRFIGVRGIPARLENLKMAIENIKPAHLGVGYEFTYTTWSEVKSITWGQVKTGTWGDLRTRKVI